MEDLIEQANEIQESLGRSYHVADEVDEADLQAELDALGLDDELVGENETPSYLQDSTALPDFVDAAPVEEEVSGAGSWIGGGGQWRAVKGGGQWRAARPCSETGYEKEWQSLPPNRKLQLGKTRDRADTSPRRSPRRKSRVEQPSRETPDTRDTRGEWRCHVFACILDSIRAPLHRLHVLAATIYIVCVHCSLTAVREESFATQIQAHKSWSSYISTWSASQNQFRHPNSITSTTS